jgi:glycosyltransferase involved in cell wall biosynthesis
MTIESILAVGCDYDILLYGRRLQGGRLKDLAKGLKSVHLRLPRAAERFIRAGHLIEGLTRGDLFHATDFYMPLGKKSKAVATICDLIFLKAIENMVDHERLARWVPEFVNNCKRIITISNFSKQEIVEELQVDPARIDVIYLGVDRNLFYSQADEETLKIRLASALGLNRPFFLAVSCYTGRKNTPLLLKAYAKLLQNHPLNDLVLVWKPPNDICKAYSAPALKNRIHFIGRQSDETLRDLYCGATALVFPSLYEGFGLPILEAMSCGTPVITSRISSMPEVGGDAAIYIDPLDSDSLVSALEEFENKRHNHQALRDANLRQADKFSWERCARETLDTYARCLAE